MAEASSTTTEKIRVVKPQGYQTIPTPAAEGGTFTVPPEAESPTRPAVRSISEPAPAADSSGILNAIGAVYQIAMDRRAWLLAELKALDAALAPFADAANQPAATAGPPSDSAVVSALVQFARTHGHDVK